MIMSCYQINNRIAVNWRHLRAQMNQVSLKIAFLRHYSNGWHQRVPIIFVIVANILTKTFSFLLPFSPTSLVD